MNIVNITLIVQQYGEDLSVKAYEKTTSYLVFDALEVLNFILLYFTTLTLVLEQHLDTLVYIIYRKIQQLLSACGVLKHHQVVQSHTMFAPSYNTQSVTLAFQVQQ